MGDARLELAKQLMHWALNPTPLASRVTSQLKKNNPKKDGNNRKIKIYYFIYNINLPNQGILQIITTAAQLKIINKTQRINAFTGSVYGNLTTNGSNGNLNKLCTKNTANEYFDKKLTNGKALTFFILEHNSNNANEPVKMNGNSYHRKKSYPLRNEQYWNRKHITNDTIASSPILPDEYFLNIPFLTKYPRII